MAAPKDWCSNQVSKLEAEDSRISTLNDIKSHFAAITQEEAVLTANCLELTQVFDCLNDSNPEQVELACEVLTLCLSNLNLGESTKRYGISLERALNHPYSNVKIMALEEIQRHISDEVSLIDLSKRHSLINALIQCIGNDDLTVAKRASVIVVKVGMSPEGIRHLLAPDCLKTIQTVMANNAVVRLRFNEIFIDISKNSEASMQALQSTGLIPQMLQDIDNNDVLLKMNIIELLAQLVVTKHGYVYLESQGVIQDIFKYFDDDDPLILQLCEPGIIKFFGRLAHWKPIEIFSKYPRVVDKLFTNLESTDLTLVGVSIDTIGYIGDSNEGKYAFDTTGAKFTQALKLINDRLSSFPTEIRLRAVACLENIIRVGQFERRVTDLVHKWYSALGDDPMEWIYIFAQNPFSELRLAGLGLINAVATHHWGQECLRNTPGFVEFLLDRRIETDKGCKEAKYEIIKTLSNSSVFDHNTQSRFQAYLKEGPFYVQAITEVAMEGAD